MRHRRALDTTSGKIAFLTASPRYLIEGMGILLIIFLAMDTYQSSQNPQLVLPTLGVLALGAQRLLPYLQQLYASYATIVSSEQSVLDALEILEYSADSVRYGNKTISFEKSIELKGCYFKYSGNSDSVLRDINLTIKKGQKVGFIGPTGSGKSTLIDILMGFLEPHQGELLIDGRIIDKSNLFNWQSKIFHVPQQIILSDTSIKNNIAFGEEESDISIERVIDACNKAKLTDYVKGQSRGYDTLVGERGIQLSGGQRQRIGIARALYRGGEVIVLDEATNALDSKTELLVNDAIDCLSESITKIIIAHNHDTIKNCDIIFVLDRGRIVEIGSYQAIQQSSTFKEIFKEV